VKLSNDGLSLWYGTPDAPAPLDEIVARSEARLVVGVHPANPTNAVLVRYRVDGGIPQSVPGRELRTDYDRQAQYFVVDFPAFPTGDFVEYSPVLSCAGRQVPPPPVANRFPSKFRLAAKERPPAPMATRRTPPEQRFVSEMQFVAAITVRVDRQFVGETPGGVRIDFFAREGRAVGPSFQGKVIPGSSDHMIVRPDGIGVIRVRAAIAADDGAMLEVEEIGSIDFGPDGYQRAVANDLPSESPLVVCPRIVTGHPKYKWLNRVQCLGIGRTRLDEDTVAYDVFAVTAGRLPS
jgi:hypothetical protein